MAAVSAIPVTHGSVPADFEAWLHAPVARGCPDARFEIRRATPQEYPRIYDAVDTVFGRPRGRATFDWLYTRNPLGPARCWLMIERASGRLAATVARYPWPVALGGERLCGEFGGDMVILPEWRGQGLYPVFMQVRDSHAWHADTVVLGAPNLGSRKALARAGLGHILIGPLPFAVGALDVSGILAGRSWPRTAARLTGTVGNAVLAAWRRLALASGDGIRIEQITRFEGETEKLALECDPTMRYWCPYTAEFLNWRYFDNPSAAYLAHAAVVDERLRGYSVLRIAGNQAMLMAFVAAPAPSAVAAKLLLSGIEAAREAGCCKMVLYASPHWRHWPLFRRCGFVSRRAESWRSARCARRPDVSDGRNWRFLPGDSDVL